MKVLSGHEEANERRPQAVTAKGFAKNTTAINKLFAISTVNHIYYITFINVSFSFSFCKALC